MIAVTFSQIYIFFTKLPLKPLEVMKSGMIWKENLHWEKEITSERFLSLLQLLVQSHKPISNRNQNSTNTNIHILLV